MIDRKSQVKTKENKTPQQQLRERTTALRELGAFPVLESAGGEREQASFLRLLCCSGIIHPGNLSKCRRPTDRAPETVVSVKVSSRQDESELMGGPQGPGLGVQEPGDGGLGANSKGGDGGT